MKNEFLGKILMSISAIQYGFIPPFVDFNNTHATNPLWVSHARFHVVWQVFITFSLSLLSLYLLWKKNNFPSFSIKIAFYIGFSVLGSFMINTFLMKFYGGSLSDPNGVPPILNIDANLLSFSVALLFLISGFIMISSSRKAKFNED